MAIEHSAVGIKMPVGCRSSVTAWKVAHCPSEPGERQEASIKERVYSNAFAPFAQSWTDSRNGVAPIGNGSAIFQIGKVVKTGQLISGAGCA